MATDPEPPTDIQSRYREVDDYSLVVETLRAYREELDEYILADRELLSSATPEPRTEQEPETEGQEDEEQGESTRGLSPATIPGRGLPRDREYVQGRLLGDRPTTASEETVMKDHGWVQYDHGNNKHYEVQYADEGARDTYH